MGDSKGGYVGCLAIKGGRVRIWDGGWDPSRLVNHADHPRLAVRVLGAAEPRRGGARDADSERRGSGCGSVGCGHEGRAKAAGERRAGGGEGPLRDVVQAWVEEEEERVAGGGGGYGGLKVRPSRPTVMLGIETFW